MMLEEQDEGMLIDERNLKIEVSVRAGQHHAVECTTVIEINLRDRYAASNKLRDTIQTIRNGMPIEELKSEDREHLREVNEMVLSSRGEVRVVPVGTVKAERDLASLKQQLPPERSENGEPTAELPDRA